jgi:HK97 family phage portal protein
MHPDRVRWAIYPQTPGAVDWRGMKPQNGELWYYVRSQSGQWVPFADEDVLHIRGLGGDGISGYDIVTLMSEALGVPMAATRFGARYFANNATPGVILGHPGKLSPQAHKNIRESFEARHKGLDNSHVMGIIEEGMTATQLECKATDAQLLETRRFGTEDVSRYTRIPLHMLADLTHATFSNIEEQGMEYGKFCQTPWKTNWEQELNRKLFYGTRQFPWVDISELMRGNSLSRAQANQIKFQNGIIDIDEWRRDDGKNPLPNGVGKVRIIPLNMQQLPGTGAPMMPIPAQPKEIAAPKEGK